MDPAETSRHGREVALHVSHASPHLRLRCALGRHLCDICVCGCRLVIVGYSSLTLVPVANGFALCCHRVGPENGCFWHLVSWHLVSKRSHRSRQTNCAGKSGVLLTSGSLAAGRLLPIQIDPYITVNSKTFNNPYITVSNKTNASNCPNRLLSGL